VHRSSVRKIAWYAAAVVGGVLVLAGTISYFFPSQVGEVRYLFTASGLLIGIGLGFTRELRDH